MNKIAKSIDQNIYSLIKNASDPIEFEFSSHPNINGLFEQAVSDLDRVHEILARNKNIMLSHKTNQLEKNSATKKFNNIISNISMLIAKLAVHL